VSITTRLNLADFEDAARSALPAPVYDYFAGGAEDERTLSANRSSFDRYFLVPRVLVDVSAVDTRVTLLGHTYDAPVFIAPTAFQRLAHDLGETATARAAASLNALYIASSLSTTSLEEIADAAPAAPRWFQLYVFRDRELTRSLVQRAEASGYHALCLTTTVPVQGKRERDARNSFTLPPGIDIANFRGLLQHTFPNASGSRLEAFIAREFDPSLSWATVEWLASITSLPIVLKGILHPDDARRAVDHGIAAIIVSNHGGRQLDSAISTLDALPDLAEAVAARIPVLMDGGVRRGTDTLKAIALGAQAVLIGRPVLWGLAIDGQQGVETVLRLLNDELSRALALVGTPSLSDVTHQVLRQLP